MKKTEVIDRLQDWMTENGLDVHHMPEDQVIYVEMEADHPFNRFDVLVFVMDDHYMVNTRFPLEANQRNMQPVMELITCVNANMSMGDLRLSPKAGMISHKAYVDFAGVSELSDEVIQTSLQLGVQCFGDVGRLIAGVLFDFMSASEACDCFDRFISGENHARDRSLDRKPIR